MPQAVVAYVAEDKYGIYTKNYHREGNMHYIPLYMASINQLLSRVK